MKYKIKYLILLVLCSDVFAENTIDKECHPGESIAIIYLNGVGNTEAQAGRSREHIKEIIDKKNGLAGVSSEHVCMANLYNQTVNASGDVNEGGVPLGDFVETVAQKIEEEKERKNEKMDWKQLALALYTKDYQSIIDDLKDSLVVSPREFIF